MTATAAFLNANGYRLQFDGMEAFSFLVRLSATGTFRFEELEAWLREHAVPLDPPV